MQQSDSLYIDGKRRAASNGATFTVINPATEEPLGQVTSAIEQDVGAFGFSGDGERAGTPRFAGLNHKKVPSVPSVTPW